MVDHLEYTIENQVKSYIKETDTWNSRILKKPAMSELDSSTKGTVQTKFY